MGARGGQRAASPVERIARATDQRIRRRTEALDASHRARPLEWAGRFVRIVAKMLRQALRRRVSIRRARLWQPEAIHRQPGERHPADLELRRQADRAGEIRIARNRELPGAARPRYVHHVAGSAVASEHVEIDRRRIRRVAHRRRLPARGYVTAVERRAGKPGTAVPALDEIAGERKSAVVAPGEPGEMVQALEHLLLRRARESCGECLLGRREIRVARVRERRVGVAVEQRVQVPGQERCVDVAAVAVELGVARIEPAWRSAVADGAGAGHVLLAPAVEVDGEHALVIASAIGCVGVELRNPAGAARRRARVFHRHRDDRLQISRRRLETAVVDDDSVHVAGSAGCLGESSLACRCRRRRDAGTCRVRIPGRSC